MDPAHYLISSSWAACQCVFICLFSCKIPKCLIYHVCVLLWGLHSQAVKWFIYQVYCLFGSCHSNNVAYLAYDVIYNWCLIPVVILWSNITLYILSVSIHVLCCSINNGYDSCAIVTGCHQHRSVHTPIQQTTLKTHLCNKAYEFRDYE